MSHPAFEAFLAHQCAPVLLGKKPAALLAASAAPEICPWELLRAQGFQTLKLRWRHKRMLLFFRPGALEGALADPQARGALAQLGYPAGGDLKVLLRALYARFRDSGSFPREVVFFLGYPPEDVLGFMRCDRDCKRCGPWKVFGDEGRAAALMAEHARCKEKLVKLLGEGGSILAALAG